MSGFELDLERLMSRFEATLPKENRTAQYERMAQWNAEDGWIVGYTTTRVVNSEHDGKFLVAAWKPFGPGARTSPTRWKLAYERSFTKRNLARARALRLLAQHSPKWAAAVTVDDQGRIFRK